MKSETRVKLPVVQKYDTETVTVDSSDTFYIGTLETELSAGVIKKSFPIVCGQLNNIGDSQLVGYYGDNYKIIRTDHGEYDFVAIECDLSLSIK